MEHLWTGGFDGPAPDFEEFIVSQENDFYAADEGHLTTPFGELLMYAPATKKKGVIPDGIHMIAENAFCLLDEPLEKLKLPSSICRLEFQRTKNGWFYEAEVDAENGEIKAIDGSIYTIDGKVLVRAKVSQGDFKIADGTETIFTGALQDVSGRIYIPASVTSMGEFLHRDNVIRTPKGSFADQLFKNKNRCELILENGEIEVREPEFLSTPYTDAWGF